MSAGAPSLLRAGELAQAWAGQAQWRILETGFGPGLNFLAAWQAWRDDPQRPGLLHHCAIDAQPLAADALLRAAAAHPELLPLAQQLAAQWSGMAPGFQRLGFEDGRVLLTLCVGEVQDMLRAQDFSADTVLLAQAGPADLHTLKSVARLCRRGSRVALASPVTAEARAMAQCGFAVDPEDTERAAFEPAWEPRGLRAASSVATGSCAVVGGGLAGAAVAASLARRGWQVQVLDAHDQPAGGASGLPVGLLAPHQSPDDDLLSRLGRAGVRLTLQQAAAQLQAGQDWQGSGVREQRPGEPAVWHPQGAWIKPAALVQAWLRRSGIQWRGQSPVARLTAQADGGWELLGAGGTVLARADLVVVACAHGSEALLEAGLPLQPVRGQVSWAPRAEGQDFPAFPVNGHGYFVTAFPLEGAPAWLCGAGFDRDDTGCDLREADHQANLARLRELLPEVADQLAGEFARGAVQGWAGVRCSSADRRPLLGQLRPGLWTSSAMGSRGLTFAVLCAELLAARLHGEPLPLPRKLAATLDVQRQTSLQPALNGPE
ncbi:FAD-dependent oxidoreductase [uncultured Ramlibacter sp.]|uniref:FAD-dependent oxidoreductase n=1 Tax=uncultured Ramlibacter sp. TaxID=260755 RepID=UPI0026064686|nr:FAD-dependent oxidoreductase [uncultured Ramlibacter sp.]